MSAPEPTLTAAEQAYILRDGSEPWADPVLGDVDHGGFIAGYEAAEAAAAQALGVAMTRWEYIERSFRHQDTLKNRARDKLLADLNREGRQGWELVAILDSRIDHQDRSVFKCLFRRPLAEKAAQEIAALKARIERVERWAGLAIEGFYQDEVFMDGTPPRCTNPAAVIALRKVLALLASES